MNLDWLVELIMIDNGNINNNGWIIFIPSGKLTVCYWKWPIEIVDLPIKTGDFPYFFVSLPEGRSNLYHMVNIRRIWLTSGACRRQRRGRDGWLWWLSVAGLGEKLGEWNFWKGFSQANLCFNGISMGFGTKMGIWLIDDGWLVSLGGY